MGEVRACVYFSVIFLCIQISAPKPFFGSWSWCDFFCEDDDGSTTTVSSEDYLDDFCNSCSTPIRTTMAPSIANRATVPPGVPGPPGPPGFNQVPGMGPGPINYFMMNPPQNGGGMAFNMGPDPNRNGWYNFVWDTPGGPSASTPPPNATPAPVAPPTTAAAAPAAGAAPAAADTTAAPAVTTAAPAAPAARK